MIHTWCILQPIIYSDPNKTVGFTAYKSASRLLFATAAELRQPVRHLDIKLAFTTEKSQQDHPVFVIQIPSFHGEYWHTEKRTVKLIQNLYGTHNACYIYLEGFDAHLRHHGYHPCEENQFFYVKTLPVERIIISSTIDDFLIRSPTNKAIDDFKHMSQLKHLVTHLGAPSTFLGWTILRSVCDPIHIFQPSLISKALEQAGLINCNPRSTPCHKNPDVDEATASSPLSAPDRLLLQSLLGDLHSLSDSTRLKISFSVTLLAAHIMKPTPKHMYSLKHTLRCLSGTTTHGILYQKSDSDALSSFADVYYVAVHAASPPPVMFIYRSALLWHGLPINIILFPSALVRPNT